ncbi:MAG: TetR/AcrR family transcriptional regulator [Waddliaceae bacterium]
MSSTAVNRETAEVILDVAESLMQRLGYRAFSYRDIAERVGIKTSSIHYYFPSKADLVTALAKRWRNQVRVFIAEVDSTSKLPQEKIERIMQAYREKYAQSCEMCPCAMFSSDLANLPESAREEVRGVWRDFEKWFSKVLKEGRDTGVFRFDEAPEIKAMTMFSAIEGSSISASTFKEPERVFEMIDWLLEGLKAGK